MSIERDHHGFDDRHHHHRDHSKQYLHSMPSWASARLASEFLHDHLQSSPSSPGRLSIGHSSQLLEGRGHPGRKSPLRTSPVQLGVVVYSDRNHRTLA